MLAHGSGIQSCPAGGMDGRWMEKFHLTICINWNSVYIMIATNW
jgi:hypothetical protein